MEQTGAAHPVPEATHEVVQMVRQHAVPVHDGGLTAGLVQFSQVALVTAFNTIGTHVAKSTGYGAELVNGLRKSLLSKTTRFSIDGSEVMAGNSSMMLTGVTGAAISSTGETPGSTTGEEISGSGETSGPIGDGETGSKGEEISERIGGISGEGETSVPIGGDISGDGDTFGSIGDEMSSIGDEMPGEGDTLGSIDVEISGDGEIPGLVISSMEDEGIELGSTLPYHA